MRQATAALVALTLLACSGVPARSGYSSPATAAAGAARAVDARGVGSTIALANIGARHIAFVADEDAREIFIVDLEAKRVVGESRLGGRPSELLVLPDGRLLVALRDEAKIAAYEIRADATLGARREADTAVEPVALAYGAGRIAVTSGWGSALDVFDATLGRSARVRLDREPRGVAIADDGRTAIVSHAVGGVVSVVDLARRSRRTLPVHPPKRQASQGFAITKSSGPERFLLPDAIVDPGEPSLNPKGYGDAERTEIGDVAVVDARGAAVLPASLEGSDRPPVNPFRFVAERRDDCLLPRGAAYDPVTRTLLVGCVGVDALVAYDGLAASPIRAEKRRFPVGAGPSGVAVDAERRIAFVFSQFDRTITWVPLAALEEAEARALSPRDDLRMALPPLALAPDLALGRTLFHAVGDTRLAKDGRACASCHPDGRDDGLTWSTPLGPRRTIMLGRVAARAPLSWSGGEDDLSRRILTTLERLDGSGGLGSGELAALTRYVRSLSQPPSRAPDPRSRRGAEVFASAEAGCSRCHAGPLATDNRAHDVRSRVPGDAEPAFNTPSLRFVSGTGPWFHDGRYTSLRALLEGADGTMGHTRQLSPGDLDALEAYLESL